MKKKMVSLFVFVMLVAGFQARAQESAVDKGVSGVENVDQSNMIKNIFVCTSVDVENPITVKVQTVVIGVGQVQTKILIQKPNEAATAYFPSVNYEKSQMYTKYTYEFFNASEKLGEFSVVDSIANNNFAGHIFCGRAGCAAQPVFPVLPNCGRGSCDEPKPIVKSYKGLLKIYEKEIPFTCQ